MFFFREPTCTYKIWGKNYEIFDCWFYSALLYGSHEIAWKRNNFGHFGTREAIPQTHSSDTHMHTVLFAQINAAYTRTHTIRGIE